MRKAGATLAAENGATIHQLMALFDWDTPGQAKVYTDAADRKRLAAEAMPADDSAIRIGTEIVAPEIQGLSHRSNFKG